MLYSLKFFLDQKFSNGDEEWGRCDDFVIDEGTWNVEEILASDGGFIFRDRFTLEPSVLETVELESCMGGIPISLSKRAVDGLAVQNASSEGEDAVDDRAKRNLISLRALLDCELRSSSSTLGKLDDAVVNVVDFSIPFLAIDSKPSERGGLRLLSTNRQEIHLEMNTRDQCLETDLSVYHLLESPSADLSDGRLPLGDQRKISIAQF